MARAYKTKTYNKLTSPPPTIVLKDARTYCSRLITAVVRIELVGQGVGTRAMVFGWKTFETCLRSRLEKGWRAARGRQDMVKRVMWLLDSAVKESPFSMQSGICSICRGCCHAGLRAATRALGYKPNCSPTLRSWAKGRYHDSFQWTQHRLFNDLLRKVLGCCISS